MDAKMQDTEHGGPPRSIVNAAAALITVRLTAIIYMVYAQIQGLGVLAGGTDRFSADHTAYQIASAFPGGVKAWGISLFTLGVVGLYAITANRRRLSFGTFSLMGIWSLMFSLCFARAAAIFPSVSSTGMWTYGKDAAVFIVMAAVMYSNHYRKEI